MIERLSMLPADEWTMEDYILGLKGKDWSFIMADDGDSWRRGCAEDDKLRKVQKRLDPEGVIWDKYDWMKGVKL